MDENIQEFLNYGLTKAIRRGKRYKSNDAWWDWDRDYRKYDHGRDDIKQFYKLLDKFLEQNVGRPYRKVYGEFCAKWPAMICGDVDTRSAFRNKCTHKQYHNNWEYNQYAVNDHGLLIKNPNSYESKRHKEKYKTIGYDCPDEYRWVFNKEWFKYPDVIDYLNDNIGILNTYNIEKDEYIPTKLVEVLNSKGYSFKEFFTTHKHYIDCHNWVFDKKVFHGNPIIIKRGTKEYKRYFIENAQRTKRSIAEWKKKREEYLNGLLHTIENERKEKEYEKDIVDRDRLGFDDESFKGEFYHGQKRKKKKEC